jgi:hypothetical protein
MAAQRAPFACDAHVWAWCARERRSLGNTSSPAWTSPWFCGSERSLACYFNFTSCCAAATVGARLLTLPRRRDPINVAARGYNSYGSAWVSAQLIGFLFERLTPQTQVAIGERRRATLEGAFRRTSGARRLTIGMHIRRGDSCHKGRYCPANLTSSYFAAAAKLRDQYGANRILLATDDGHAAELCRAGVLGFDCHTQEIERDKFDSSTLIEHRVALHAHGSLSGSTVALDALADIDMLANTDMFVMLLRSCFARVAYGLAMFRKGRPPPLISLEAPWSPYKGFAKAKGFTTKGRMAAPHRSGMVRQQRRARRAAVHHHQGL